MHRWKHLYFFNIRKISLPQVILAFSLLGILYVMNSWTPSSYGCALTWLGVDNRPFYGESRSIRSDEWCVFTPTVQATVNNNFKRYNKTSIYDDDLRVNWGMPIYDWALIFKPYFWGFYIFTPPYAYSLYYFLNFSFFVFGFLLVIAEFRYSILESLFYSLSLYFTAGIQVWWSSNAPIFSIFPWVLYGLLICSNKIIGYPILFYSLASWCLGEFYPPFIYSFILLAFAFTLITGKYNINFVNSIICTIIIVVIAYLVYSYFKDYISQLQNTFYPGKRSLNGGDTYFWLKIKSFFFPNLNIKENYQPIKNVTNICELSITATIFPLLLLYFGIFKENTKNKNTLKVKSLQLTIGVLIFIILFLWVVAPIPSTFGKYILIDKIPPERILLCLTIVLNLFLICRYSEIPWRINVKNIIVFWICYFLIICTFDFKSHFGKSNIISLSFISLVMIISTFLKINNRTIISVSSLLFAIIYFFSFNPLQSAIPIFEKHNTTLTRDIETEVKNYGVATMSCPGSVINGLGYPSISHVNIIPAIKFWEKKFPNMDSIERNIIFNRYGHVHLDNVNIISNPQADVISIPRKYFSGKPLDPSMSAN
jgi:hypothetical protein